MDDEPGFFSRAAAYVKDRGVVGSASDVIFGQQNSVIDAPRKIESHAFILILAAVGLVGAALIFASRQAKIRIGV